MVVERLALTLNYSIKISIMENLIIMSYIVCVWNNVIIKE